MFHWKSYLMMPGGSLFFGFGTPIGTIGFIEAAFELNYQVKKGNIPEPDVIFIPGASCGSAAGLIIGLNMLNLKTKVHVVAVGDKNFVNDKVMIKNIDKTLKFLIKQDNSFPNIEIAQDSYEIIYGYLGPEYGAVTEEAQIAVDLVMRLEGNEKDFILETTYTGKTMAAMMDYLEKKENKSKIVLFWNTYNSNNLDIYLKEKEFIWNDLPKKFHQFFEDKSF